MPGVTLLKLTETDTFTARVDPRNEFVQTDRVKTVSVSCYCPLPAKAKGQSNRLRPNLPFGKLKTQRIEQGSNISSGCPGATRGYSQTN